MGVHRFRGRAVDRLAQRDDGPVDGVVELEGQAAGFLERGKDRLTGGRAIWVDAVPDRVHGQPGEGVLLTGNPTEGGAAVGGAVAGADHDVRPLVEPDFPGDNPTVGVAIDRGVEEVLEQRRRGRQLDLQRARPFPGDPDPVADDQLPGVDPAGRGTLRREGTVCEAGCVDRELRLRILVGADWCRDGGPGIDGAVAVPARVDHRAPRWIDRCAVEGPPCQEIGLRAGESAEGAVADVVDVSARGPDPNVVDEPERLAEAAGSQIDVADAEKRLGRRGVDQADLLPVDVVDRLSIRDHRRDPVPAGQVVDEVAAANEVVSLGCEPELPARR